MALPSELQTHGGWKPRSPVLEPGDSHCTGGVEAHTEGAPTAAGPASSGALDRPQASPELVVPAHLLVSAVPWMGGTKLSSQSLSPSYPAPSFGLFRGQQAAERPLLRPFASNLPVHILWLNSGTVLLTES